ncbi:tellurium resistance protein TerC [Beijerinckiaceae bacterium]|nr:tellurium resistance protein TerC [Beijerinckiaceae bacterium]
MDFSTTAFWLPLLEIIWIDILLSGDNAVVIALACRSLPDGQRKAGIVLGSSAAVALRVVCTFLVVELLALPFVKVGGGLLLLWIAIRLVGEEAPEKAIKPANTLWSAIRIIVVADAVMSLDNMMAVAAAAKGSKLLILLGLALSIPFIIFGSTLLLPLFNRFPILIWAGAALLGWVAGDLIGADPEIEVWLRPRLPNFELWCAAAGAFFVMLVGWLGNRQKSVE